MLFGNFVEAQSRSLIEAIDQQEFAEDYGYSSDSDIEDEEDQWSIRQCGVASHLTNSGVLGLSGSPMTSSKDKIVYEDHDECVRQGRVVKIPDVAYVT